MEAELTAFTFDGEVSVVRIEVFNLINGLGHRGRELHQTHVLRSDVVVAHDGFIDETHPLFPKRPVRHVEQHDRRGSGLARVEERQDLEEFVHGPQSSGQDHEGIGRPSQSDLAGEEVPHGHQHRGDVDEGVGVLFEREFDVHPEGVLLARPFRGCLHDAWSGARNGDPATLGHGTCELDGHLVERAARFRSGRAEHGQLGAIAPFVKERERF